MPQPHTVVIDDVTKLVVSEIQGGKVPVVAPPGRTAIVLPDNTPTIGNKRWVSGTTFVAVTTPLVDPDDKPLSPREMRAFLRRIETNTDRIT